MSFKKWGREARDTDRWRALVNGVINVIILYKMQGIFGLAAGLLFLTKDSVQWS
jgi:hypothetical protein